MKTRASFFTPLLVLGLAVLLGGCVGFMGQRRCERSSSIADFLFPKEQQTVQPSMPLLQLPLRVGVAFVPSANRYGADFSDYQKEKLLERVSETFRAQKFVDTLQVIPTTYLRTGGSFDNLDQLKRMMGIDVIVLVSYDQLQFTSDNILSLSYWTIVGAYVVKGNHNDTHTLMEAVVYDIGSRSMLFRAPGVNQTRASATGVELAEYQRRDSGASLELATDDLIKNLNIALENFRTQVKEGRAGVKIEHRAGYSGGGAADWVLVSLLGLVAAGAMLGRRHTARLP